MRPSAPQRAPAPPPPTTALPARRVRKRAHKRSLSPSPSLPPAPSGFVANCVGERNFRWFYGFLVSVSLLQLVGLLAGGGRMMELALDTPAGLAALEWMELARGLRRPAPAAPAREGAAAPAGKAPHDREHLHLRTPPQGSRDGFLQAGADAIAAAWDAFVQARRRASEGRPLAVGAASAAQRPAPTFTHPPSRLPARPQEPFVAVLSVISGMSFSAVGPLACYYTMLTASNRTLKARRRRSPPPAACLLLLAPQKARIFPAADGMPPVGPQDTVVAQRLNGGQRPRSCRQQIARGIRESVFLWAGNCREVLCSPIPPSLGGGARQAGGGGGAGGQGGAHLSGACVVAMGGGAALGPSRAGAGANGSSSRRLLKGEAAAGSSGLLPYSGSGGAAGIGGVPGVSTESG